MYVRSAPYDDAIYAAIGKDYEREAARVHALIAQHKRSPGSALLDVACGGRHGHPRALARPRRLP